MELLGGDGLGGMEGSVFNPLTPTVYRGQTGCSGHKRCREQIDVIRRGSDSSGMAQHLHQHHPGEVANADDHASLIAMKILDVRSKNLERGILEALRIEEAESCNSINTCNRRTEWGRVPLGRLTVDSSLGGPRR